MDIRNKKITVAGLGKSGYSAALLAVKCGALVKATDLNNNAAVQEAANALKGQGVEVETGAHTEGFIRNADLVITSPGIPDTAAPLAWARAAGIKVIDEIEFAYGFSRGPIIAVTGTNGKSTTTSLITHILKACGRKVFSCGNIGNPFSEKVSELEDDCIIVLEVSSFQLSRIDAFRPKTAIFLNIDDNHYDRHKDFREYLEAKLRIFENQTKDDTAVINARCRDLIAKNAGLQARALYFSGRRENELAAAAAVSVFGITKTQAEQSAAAFKPLEHRCEYVRTIEGVEFINDSKSTTVASTIKALQAPRGKIILIAGGKDKGLNYARLLDSPDFNKIRSAVLIGQAAEKIKADLDGKLDIKQAESLKEATELAFLNATKNDTVLLSPMCSSFDQFNNFEHRGEVFKDAVKKLNSKSQIPNKHQ